MASKSKKHKHKKHKKSSSSSSDAGHFSYKIGMKVKKGQFKITKFLGDGTFGRVLEVKNDGRFYAMKCIRAVERYIESAKIETKILWHIQDRDKEGKYQIVKLYTTFERHENYFMIFERLGKSLFDLIKKNEYKGFPIKYVQSFFKQMLTSVGFLHTLGITHTDLKPENILLTNCDLIKINKQKNFQQFFFYKSTSLYLPSCDTIKIIDMGGATFAQEYHSTVINTRQYRAPEVIMGGIKWDCSSDVWCIACIVLELLNGDLFYQGKEDKEHLAMIEKSCGPVPFWMIDRFDSKMNPYFSTSKTYFEENHTYYTWPKCANSHDSIIRVQEMKTIDDLIVDQQLNDLLKKLMVIDPQKRLTCQQALQHPFFSQIYD